MARRRLSLLVKLLILAALPIGWSDSSAAQAPRNIKVVLETKQSGASHREVIQGSGSVVIHRGTVHPSGRIIADESRTTVQRSSGVFTLVRDGGESILTVATRVPQSEISYYYNYALGVGAIERRVIFTDVDTSLRVSAMILPDGQIQLRLIPRISYFSPERPGAIDFTEAATDLIVTAGQPVSLGGSTTSLREITRQILGYRSRDSSSESNLVVIATFQ